MNRILRNCPIWAIFIISSVLGLIGGVIDTVFDLRLSAIPQMIVDGENIIKSLIVITVLLIVSGLDGGLSRSTMRWMYLRVANREYSRLLEKEYSANLQYIMSTHTGALNAAISSYADTNAELWVTAKKAIWLLPSLSMFVYKTYTICGGWALVIDLIALVITGVICNVGCNKFDSKERIAQNANLRRITQDNMGNIKTLRYLGKKNFAMGRLHEAQHNSIVYSLQFRRSLLLSELQVGILAPLIINLFMIYNNGNANITDIAYNIASTGVMNNVINIITDAIDTITLRADNAKALKELEQIESERVYEDIPDEVHIQNVKFGYKDSDIEINIPDISFNKNDRVSITGESGQGKSSLANLLVGVLTPFEGEVPHFRTFYIHQETECLDDSLRNNMTFGNTSISDEELFELLDRVGLKEWVIALPEKLETRVGERGTKLSSGQKQRLNIIRAIIEMRRLDPNCLVILDEPTSNLDDETEKLVVSLIEENCKNTMMVVTHRPAICGICNRHIRIENHVFSEE